MSFRLSNRFRAAVPVCTSLNAALSWMFLSFALVAEVSAQQIDQNTFGCSLKRVASKRVGLIPLFSLLLFAVTVQGKASAGELIQKQPASAVQATQAVTTLEMGRTIASELTGGQRHNYQISLAAGQYVSVIVEQRGIDLVVQLLETDGKLSVEYDSEIRTQGEERVVLVAETAGVYRLLVKAKYERLPAGRYEIRWPEVRTATEKDWLLYEAVRLKSDADEMVRAGKYDEALPLAEKSLAIREQELGAEHPDVANSLYSLAGILSTQGDYKRAEPLYQRAVDIAEKALGQEHPLLALYLSRFANLYYYTGDYARAERLYKLALLIQEKTLGVEHPDVGYTLDRLAYVYRTQGDFTRAEPLFQRSLVLAEKTLGEDDIGVGRALIDFANFYREKGDYAKAEPMYQRGLRIWEKAEGANHPNYAGALNNLANLYRDKRDYDKAEPLYQRALSIKEKALGTNHPDVARYRENLASLYYAQGDYPKAERLYLSVPRDWGGELRAK